mgnify:CR=1 FL=1
MFYLGPLKGEYKPIKCEQEQEFCCDFPMLDFMCAFFTQPNLKRNPIHMKKKLLVVLIAVIPMLMPNLASAVAVDSCYYYGAYVCGGY